MALILKKTIFGVLRQPVQLFLLMRKTLKETQRINFNIPLSINPAAVLPQRIWKRRLKEKTFLSSWIGILGRTMIKAIDSLKIPVSFELLITQETLFSR